MRLNQEEERAQGPWVRKECIITHQQEVPEDCSEEEEGWRLHPQGGERNGAPLPHSGPEPLSQTPGWGRSPCNGGSRALSWEGRKAWESPGPAPGPAPWAAI